LCGCGQIPNKGRQWLKGHAARGRGGFKGEPAAPVLPGPAEAASMTEAEWDALVAAETAAEWAEPSGPLTAGGLPGSPVTETIPPGLGDGRDDLRDAEPAHGSDGWARETARIAAPRVTAAMRRDIAAKIAIPFTVSGAIWEARDPLCGGAFNAQRSALAADLAALACDSPWWVQFFTGPAGGYMRYIQLAADVWPVVEMILAHHVLHRVGQPPAGGQGPADATTPPPAPDFGRYPA
jgi:hypothetical protein